MLTQIALAVLIPGWNTRRRIPQLALALFVAGVVLPLGVAAWAVLSGRQWIALTLDAGFLAWVIVVGVIALVARLVAAAEVWLGARADRSPEHRDRWAIGLVVLLCAPLMVGVVQVGQARAAIMPAFEGQSDQPLFDNSAATPSPTVPTSGPTSTTQAPPDPDAPGVPTVGPASTTTTTLPPKPERPRSGVAPGLVGDVTNILLLGGDAGPGRSGLRTDSMMLFSLHRASGRASLISIPRDLAHLLFPPGSALEARYPYGFTEIANAVYPIVSSQPDLREAYEREGVRAGVVAIAQALGYSLDVTIDDYVLIDMQGFLELIDALGGVTVNVPKAVPMPGNVPGAPTQYPDTIGPGLIEMDGTTALGYVRSRKADSDYQRTRRQRQLLEALATQISFNDVIRSFGGVAAAIGGTLRTSLSPDELADTLAVIGGSTAIVESVGLVPPLVDMSNPDYGELARIVGAVRVAIATGTDSGY